jgi:hypothetical protein
MLHRLYRMLFDEQHKKKHCQLPVGCIIEK